MLMSLFLAAAAAPLQTPEDARATGTQELLVAESSESPKGTDRTGGAEAETGLYVPAQRWALVIGASAYPNLGTLSFAARDAEAFASTLTERFGFDKNAVSLLTDTAGKPKLRPTAGNMFLALRRLLADPRRQETDLFVFYFAGHGIGDEEGDFLLPLDGALETIHDVGLSVDAVIDELTSAGMQNVLFVVDGCRTGEKNSFGAELWRRAEEANLAVVLSCEPGQLSYEDRRLGGGVFTHSLVGALEDPALVDSASGALWASKVAASARSKSEAWTSRGFDGAQVPQVWTDPTRDVLLGAALPDLPEGIVSSFLNGAEKLSTESYLAAAGQFAELLFMEGRFAECAELLKAAEQLGDLSPQLLYMFADSLQMTGRLSEMTRVQDELRAADPGSFYTLIAIAHDMSGETSALARYDASRTLWRTFGVESEDLALLVAFNFASGGPPDEARAVIETMLPHFAPGTRAEAYARYMLLLIGGDYDAALELLKEAEALPGDYPGIWRLRVERHGLLQDLGKRAALEDLYAQCIEDWPLDGEWRAQRGLLRFEARRWDEALADALAASKLPLEPWALILAVRAAGIDSAELHESIKSAAEAYPLSWQAQLALAMTTLDSEASHQAALDAAKRLAPNLGTWSTAVARMQYERGLEAFHRDLLDGLGLSNLRYTLLGILADRAGELEQGEGWELLCILAAACSRQVQVADLIELHLGDALASGRLERSLVGCVSAAFLDAGRLERFRETVRLAAPGSDVALGSVWLEAAWLVAADRDDEARAVLEDQPPAVRTMAAAGPAILARLAARAGDVDEAKRLLEGAPEPGPNSFLAQVMVGLAWDALGQTERADELFAPILNASGARPFFAKVAAWKAIYRRGLGPEVCQTIAWAAGRDGVGNPLARELSFAAAPGLDAFRGTVEFDLDGDGEALSAPGATLLLTVRKAGKVSGIVERPDGDVWLLKGTIDEYGNLTAALLGAERSARIFAKLAPPELYETCVPLVDHGIVFFVVDEAARVSGWAATLTP